LKVNYRLDNITILRLQRCSDLLGPDAPEKWPVALGDEMLQLKSKDPEHDACRELLKRGYTGKVKFIHASGMEGLTMGIK
jgi:hypothetical protein